jgi:hypothetical protein
VLRQSKFWSLLVVVVVEVDMLAVAVLVELCM